MSDRRAKANTGQGVAALIGITVGVIPLIGLAIGRGPGLWTVVLGDSAAIWWAPAAVLLTCLVVIALLERSARR